MLKTDVTLFYFYVLQNIGMTICHYARIYANMYVIYDVGEGSQVKQVYVKKKHQFLIIS